MLKLVTLAGPTAAGKTKTALELAEQINAEIVSADSVQVYRYLDIGSAKPTLEAQNKIPHHLIDIITPDETMNAGKWVELADRAINDISARHKACLIVGGTGLYIKSLIYGLAAIPEIDKKNKMQLLLQGEKFGWPYMHDILKQRDPVSADKIHPNDSQRILRALSVLESTGQPLSVYQARHFKKPRYEVLFLGFRVDKTELDNKIVERCALMLEQGLLKEVENLLAKGFSPESKGLQTLGYKQALDIILKKISIAEGLQEMVIKTIAYAKRQMTWFRAQPGIIWVEPANTNAIIQMVKNFYHAGK